MLLFNYITCIYNLTASGLQTTLHSDSMSKLDCFTSNAGESDERDSALLRRTEKLKKLVAHKFFTQHSHPMARNYRMFDNPSLSYQRNAFHSV